MSIISVKEDWQAWNGNLTIDPDTLRPEGEFVRAFDVQFSENDTSFKPIEAIYAPGVPQAWEVIPGYPWAYVVGHTVTMSDSPLLAKVTVKYKVWEDPLAIPPRIDWDFGTETDVVNKAVRCKINEVVNFVIEEDKGNPISALLGGTEQITNSAGEMSEDPIVKEYRDLIMSVRVNRAAYDHNAAADYIDAVNSDIFKGFLPGKVKCKKYSATPARAGALEYWVHSYEFQVRTKKSDPLNIGWLRRIQDQGFRQVVSLGDGRYEMQAIGDWLVETDSNGNETKRTFKPVARPVNLDGMGAKLGDAKPPVFLLWRDFDLLPFSHFGLG